MDNCATSAQTRYDVMHIAVTKYPMINFNYKGYKIPSFLDSDSNVTLICQSYFDHNLMYLVSSHLDEKSEAHICFI